MREKQAQRKDGWSMYNKPFKTKFPRDALKDSVEDRISQQVSDGIKRDVRREIKGTFVKSFGLKDSNADYLAVTRLKGIEHRAWMLLQAAGMHLFFTVHTVQLTTLDRVSRYREID
jgi:hypothetical protein